MATSLGDRRGSWDPRKTPATGENAPSPKTVVKGRLRNFLRAGSKPARSAVRETPAKANSVLPYACNPSKCFAKDGWWRRIGAEAAGYSPIVRTRGANYGLIPIPVSICRFDVCTAYVFRQGKSARAEARGSLNRQVHTGIGIRRQMYVVELLDMFS